MSLIIDLQDRIDEQTGYAKLVSNHTTPQSPEAWRADSTYGREVTFLEAVLLEVQAIQNRIEELNCAGEWCGKSPTKHSDGLCGVCTLQKRIFVDKLKD